MTFISWIESTKPEGLLTAIVAASIGVATGRIAWVQKEIAKEKVNSDLFDRRYKIYEAHTRAIIELVLLRSSSSANEVNIADKMTYIGAQARFLYDEHVHKHLSRVRRDILEYDHLRKRYTTGESHPGDPEAKSPPQILSALDDLEVVLEEELSHTLPNLVEPYLRVRDFRRSSKSAR